MRSARRLLAGITVLAVTTLPALASASAAADTSTPQWQRETGTHAPDALVYAAMAYDAGTDQMIMFGGAKAGKAVHTTTAWDGSQWTKLHPDDHPPKRWQHVMAYDPVRDEVVMFGGEWSHPYKDTWVFKDGQWTRRDTPVVPRNKRYAAMAFDPHLQQLVLFGGYQKHHRSHATWTWDGSAWIKLDPSTSPPRRFGADMAYDPTLDGLVLYGGAVRGGRPGDTWLWDGQTWVEQTPEQSPPRLRFHSMSTLGDHVAIFGGLHYDEHSSAQYFDDTWITNSTWQRVDERPHPAGREGAELEWDPVRQNAVLFGGWDNYEQFGDTWTLTPTG